MSTKHNSEEMRLVKIDSPFMISAHPISLRKKKCHCWYNSFKSFIQIYRKVLTYFLITIISRGELLPVVHSKALESHIKPVDHSIMPHMMPLSNMLQEGTLNFFLSSSFAAASRCQKTLIFFSFPDPHIAWLYLK